MKRKIIILLLLAGLMGTGIYGKRWYSRSVLEGNSSIINIYGTIDIRDARLAFNEQEKIVEVLVEEGEKVTTGQVLARLQTDRLEASISEIQSQMAAQSELVKRLNNGSRTQEIDKAKAEVDATKIKITHAEQKYKRLTKTSGTGATSKQDKDDAFTALQLEKSQLSVKQKTLDLLVEGPRKEDIASAEHQLKALEAKHELLNIRLADMTLTSPSDGIIQTRILEPGEMAGPARPVFTLALTNPKWVRAYVPEPALGQIHIGMKAHIISDSYPGDSIEGWVGYISPVAEFTPRTVQTEDLRTQLVYEARVYVYDEEDTLKLGMPVTVKLDRGSTQDQTPSTISSKS